MGSALATACRVAALGAACLLQACSDPAPSAGQPAKEASPKFAAAASSASAQPAPAQSEKPAEQGFEPGDSLAFEWSANGFVQLPADYHWSGSGKQDADFRPNLSLSVPETDDVIWSSECMAGGMVKSRLYLAPPEPMSGGRLVFKFETDQSKKTLSYPAKFIATGESESIELVQRADDPMFEEMTAGTWAYMQAGESGKVSKLRVSLKNAAKSLRAFLPACGAMKK